MAAAEVQAAVVVTGADAARLWRIREDGAGLGGRTPANAPAWPGWEDAAVPPARLGEYLREFFVLLAEFGIDGLAYGHFGDGCVHCRLDFPLADQPKLFRDFLFDAAELVAGYGGSMSGEHGDGRARGELLPAMYSAAAIELFGQVKAHLRSGQPAQPGGDRRSGAGGAPTCDCRRRMPLPGGRGFSFAADGGSFSTAVHRCVGVGKCRADTTATGGVMCPSYLATRDETHSTRGRARVLQELANGELVTDGWQSPELIEVLDLCLSCRGCASDCPAGVDMATYKAEVLYQRFRRRLRPAAHYALGWLPRWARLASRAPGAGQRRAAAEAAGRAGQTGRRHRSAPAAAEVRRPVVPALVRRASGWPTASRCCSGRTPSPTRFSPEVGIAAVAVLEAAGFSVRIPDRQVCCGLTWISTGQLDGARRQLRGAFDALAPALAEGIPIVGLEPSCTAVLRSDVAELLPDDPRAEQVRQQTRTLAELLTEAGWAPPSLAGVDCGGAAALPPARRARLRGRSGAAGRGRRRAADARRLLRAGRQLRRRTRPLRGVGRGGRAGAAARGPCRPDRIPWCWPTASPAGPSWISCPIAPASTWPSCWRPGCLSPIPPSRSRKTVTERAPRASSRRPTRTSGSAS